MRWKYVDLDKGVIYVHWQITHARYKHGCQDAHACGGQWHRYPCPADCPKAMRTSGRKHTCATPCPPNCAEHNGECPKFCQPDCTRHAKACPKRIGGIKFTGPKGKRTRAIPLPAPLVTALHAHLEAQRAERDAAGDTWQDWDLVWCQPTGSPIDTDVDWEEWKEILGQAEIKDVRLHDARHTAGTLLGELHVDIHVIQRILGHAQVTTTRIYTDPTDPLTGTSPTNSSVNCSGPRNYPNRRSELQIDRAKNLLQETPERHALSTRNRRNCNGVCNRVVSWGRLGRTKPLVNMVGRAGLEPATGRL